MTDVGAIYSAARLGWQLVAKVPWLTGWLLRRVFSSDVCRSRLQVELSGSHAAFELLAVRPSHALANLEIRVYNPLPFAVTTATMRMRASIDSYNVLDVVLNAELHIPGSGSGRLVLPEVGLTGQQVQWVRNLRRDYTRVRFTLYWHCKSAVQDWEASGESDFPVFIRAQHGALAEKR